MFFFKITMFALKQFARHPVIFGVLAFILAFGLGWGFPRPAPGADMHKFEGCLGMLVLSILISYFASLLLCGLEPSLKRVEDLVKSRQLSLPCLICQVFAEPLFHNVLFLIGFHLTAWAIVLQFFPAVDWLCETTGWGALVFFLLWGLHMLVFAERDDFEIKPNKFFETLPDPQPSSELPVSTSKTLADFKTELYLQWLDMLLLASSKKVNLRTTYGGQRDLFGELLQRYDNKTCFDPVYVSRIFKLYKEICHDLRSKDLTNPGRNQNLKQVLERLSQDIIEHWQQHQLEDNSRFNSTLSAINKFMDLRDARRLG